MGNCLSSEIYNFSFKNIVCGILMRSFSSLTSIFSFQMYSPKLDSPPPRWVHFAHGLLLFLYQVRLPFLHRDFAFFPFIYKDHDLLVIVMFHRDGYPLLCFKLTKVWFGRVYCQPYVCLKRYGCDFC